MKFTQTAVFALALAGLTACASNNDVWTPYGTRTAGQAEMMVEDMEGKAAAPTATISAPTGALAACRERENRLMDMNRSCYRK